MRSARLTFSGYNFKEALFRNKDSIKAIIAILMGINVAVGVDWKIVLISLGAGVASLAVKLIADAVDFYFSDVEL